MLLLSTIGGQDTHHELHGHPLEVGSLVHVAQHEGVDAVPDLQTPAQLLLADPLHDSLVTAYLQELELVLLRRSQQLPGQSVQVGRVPGVDKLESIDQ